MSELISLLEKHKKLEQRSAFKTTYGSQQTTNTIIYTSPNKVRPDNFNDSSLKKSAGADSVAKVYVNPNYNQKMVKIHINPRVQAKPAIHVNPKLINISKNSQHTVPELNRNDASKLNKHLVHINPKLLSKIIPEQNNQIAQKENVSDGNKIATNTEIQADSSKAIMSEIAKLPEPEVIDISDDDIVELSPIVNEKSVQKNLVAENKSLKSDLWKTDNCDRKTPNTCFVALSKRKLIRVKKYPKVSMNSMPSARKKCGRKPKILKYNSLGAFKSINKISIYKVDRTKSSSKAGSTIKKTSVKRKRFLRNSIGLVSIGGVMYNFSRNQLVRSGSSSKQKASTLHNLERQYIIAKNGKKLIKLSTNKSNSTESLTINASVIKNYKTNASNKVKQRSLQILREKMRKNNQPCLIFQKFGYCTRQNSGTCSKVHDKNQVALCRNFLQGECHLENCALSHNVGPEKMPTCKYFLEGCCARDKCPYLHVKVSSKNPICMSFLRGYCSLGNECKQRHIIACPEFDRSGNCSKGKFCPYPHKSKLARDKKKLTIDKRRKKESAIDKQTDKTDIESEQKSESTDTRKRYYDEDTSEDLSKKRNSLLKKMKIIKEIYTQSPINVNTESTAEFNIEKECTAKETGTETNEEVVYTKPRRPPIGPLPAYIPID